MNANSLSKSHDTERGPDPRESFRRFPSWVQPAITFISGKPLSGSRPLVIFSPVGALAYDYAKYFIGILGAAAAFNLGGAWLLTVPLFWLATVNGARALASDAHYAGHAALTFKQRWDHILGNLISLSIISANMEDYAHRHNHDHHGKTGICTTEDPDIAMIGLMGFELGRKESYYLPRLMLTLISPRYHLLSFFFRMKTTFVTAPVWRMVVAVLGAATIAAVTYATNGFETLLVAWLLPVLPGFALSSALQFPSEHNWLAPRGKEEPYRDYVMRASWGRFFLIEAPQPGLGVVGGGLAWTAWAIRMIPHLLARSSVCVVTLPAHDFHHRFARREDWPMALYLRQAEQDQGIHYVDYYGLGAPMRKVFRNWSTLAPETLGKPSTCLALAESVLARFRRRSLEVQSQ
ncbi:fatty acid desaturase [Stappia indica]|uniref:fatty acid desaturase n=1 Tax=Stappia indica TaxID=538381 RepID=UPI001CD653EE|nr:fatty acid desaturase [Stappia indica]MCA1298586.1 fatty acid desaturase [Stappia indica]